jgi:hypothetical protein
MNIFLMSESPDIQLKTNVVAGEEVTTVRECVRKDCIGWSKNLEIEVCPFCKGKMVVAERSTPVIRAVNSCRNCFYLVKSENLCMKKEKKLPFHASDFSEECTSYKLERKAKKEERAQKESFKEAWIKNTCQ